MKLFSNFSDGGRLIVRLLVARDEFIDLPLPGCDWHLGTPRKIVASIASRVLFSPYAENEANITEELMVGQGDIFGKELLNHPREFFEIVNETTPFQTSGFIVGRSQN